MLFVLDLRCGPRVIYLYRRREFFFIGVMGRFCRWFSFLYRQACKVPVLISKREIFACKTLYNTIQTCQSWLYVEKFFLERKYFSMDIFILIISNTVCYLERPKIYSEMEYFRTGSFALLACARASLCLRKYIFFSFLGRCSYARIYTRVCTRGGARNSLGVSDISGGCFAPE